MRTREISNSDDIKGAVMSKHTPGPWKVEPMGKQLYIETEYKSALTPFVCDMQFPDCQSDEERETAQANATLIAAAPAMYEALKASLLAIPDGMTSNTSPICQQIRAALAQAEGLA